MSRFASSNGIVKHMNNAAIDPKPTDWNGQVMQKRIASRYAAERRFKAMGFLAVALSTLFLAFLLFTMLGQGLRPKGYHPLVDAKPADLIERMIGDVKRVMHGVVDQMPTHEAFIAKYCKA